MGNIKQGLHETDMSYVMRLEKRVQELEDQQSNDSMGLLNELSKRSIESTTVDARKELRSLEGALCFTIECIDRELDGNALRHLADAERSHTVLQVLVARLGRAIDALGREVRGK